MENRLMDKEDKHIHFCLLVTVRLALCQLKYYQTYVLSRKLPWMKLYHHRICTFCLHYLNAICASLKCSFDSYDQSILARQYRGKTEDRRGHDFWADCPLTSTLYSSYEVKPIKHPIRFHGVSNITRLGCRNILSSSVIEFDKFLPGLISLLTFLNEPCLKTTWNILSNCCNNRRDRLHELNMISTRCPLLTDR